MESYEGQTFTINHRVNIHIKSIQMNLYNFNGKNCTLNINETISNITINGSKNKIVVKAKIPNLIVNGSKNEINVT